MKSVVIFFVVLSLASGVSAHIGYDGNTTEYLSNLPNQEYWDGDWSIADEEGSPVIVVRSDDHIRGWIDIIGFRGLCSINETQYVNGNAADFAIVRSDSWHTPVSGTVVSFTSHYAVVDDFDGLTTAILYTDFHWKYKVYTLLGSYWVHVYESQTITYSTWSPLNYDTHIQDVPVYIVAWNRSFQPRADIILLDRYAPEMDGVMSSEITYNNSSVYRYDLVGFVVNNSKGTEYVEFVPLDDPVWVEDDDQTTISHFLGAATVAEPDFNMSKLHIQMRTPYETRDVTNYTVKTIEDAPISPNIPLVKVMMVMGASVLLIILFWKVVTRGL